MIEIKDYKYKELCKLRGEETKTGKSKQLQLKEWERFFKWVNPTTQIFRVTEVFEVPKEKIDGRKNNGGARAGAGAKVKIQDEFIALFREFLSKEQNKHRYFTYECPVIYFTNDVINKFFGVYRNIYEAKYDAEQDENINLLVYDKIADKLREKSRSWILDKIDKLDNVSLTWGIIAYKTRKDFEYRDDLLEDYYKAQQEFFEQNKLNNEKDVIDKGLWSEMQSYINSKFPDYKEIKKMHKIKYNPDQWTGVGCKVYRNMKNSFNNKIIKETYNFFLKKEKEAADALTEFNEWFGLDNDVFDEKEAMKDYVYILNKYVKVEE